MEMEINSSPRRQRDAYSAILFQGGTVIDGTGNVSTVQDVLIVGDRIQAIGHNIEYPGGTRIIDSRNKIVCPGFIDAHGHSDYHVLLAPNCESKVHQGITTEVIGNCGMSLAPLSDRNRAEVRDELSVEDSAIPWNSFGQYLEHLRQTPIGMNLVPLVGHGTVRAALFGYENKKLSTNELAQLRKAVEQASEEGARGISSGLEYPPGCFGDVRELAELVGCFQGTDGIYTTHMRDEGETLLQAIDEAIEVARRAQVKLQISHLKADRKSVV